jgi:SAM-dependent methyltransferase
MSVEAAALERLRELFRWSRERVCSLLSPWFYDYHADLYVHGLPFDVYVEKARAIARELQGARRVLDLGAGFAVQACLLRILGIPRVVALDYHGPKVRDARILVRHLGLEGVDVLRGDALALPFVPESFDGATAMACLSHIREPALALSRLAELLPTGARVYVFEDNNSRWPGYERCMSAVWEAAERGTGGEGDGRGESFLELRRGIVRRVHPDLPEEELDRCARETRGLYGDGLLRVVSEYRRTGVFRNPRRHLVCHPVSGEFEEYPLDPFQVRTMLIGAGFRTRLRSPFHGPFRGRFRVLKRTAAVLFRLVPWVLPWASPTFAFVGERR